MGHCWDSLTFGLKLEGIAKRQGEERQHHVE